MVLWKYGYVSCCNDKTQVISIYHTQILERARLPLVDKCLIEQVQGR